MRLFQGMANERPVAVAAVVEEAVAVAAVVVEAKNKMAENKSAPHEVAHLFCLIGRLIYSCDLMYDR
jgi:hypothetical protein